MRFYNANYMKTVMVWAVLQSQHTYSNDFNIWEDCQEGCVRVKKFC